ncbi:hypothetical protein OIE61_37780 [Streptomyces sp. NBC_01762]|nr:hypothetical protein [Streptomyces sp. NBC_01762]WSC49222.1 hypothetical protein OIE61_37780 [Streptomyces sp. NBC_01762]
MNTGNTTPTDLRSTRRCTPPVVARPFTGLDTVAGNAQADASAE